MSECQSCFGAGYVQTDDGPMGIPQATPCVCTIQKSLKIQAEKAWKGLGAYPVKPSLLEGKMETCLFITAHQTELLLALRGAMAHRNKSHEFVKIVSDADCLSAWLGSARLAGESIADPDFQHDLNVFSLQALVEPCSLLIVLLGVKVARNAAMSEVLHETIRIRQFLGKPLWVIQEPNRPLEEGHLAWSRAVEVALDGWARISLVNQKSQTARISVDTTSQLSSSTLSSHPNLPAPRHKTLKLGR